MSDAWPEPDVLIGLFQRLRAGDMLAQSDFLAAVLDPLVAHLRRRGRTTDEHVHLTAAEDAVLSVIHNPAVYDPQRSSLVTFLRIAAEGDLANALVREQRHQRRREDRDCVELPADAGNSVAEDQMGDLPSFDDPNLAAVISTFTEPERRVFELMRAGERRTDAFAAALGISDRPAEEQARRVKQVKDRIIKRLQRARDES